MPPPYNITIGMSQPTLTALQNSGFYLCGFKGVSPGIQIGEPVLWLQSRYISLNTVVAWSETYQAQTSKSQLLANAKIMTAAAYSINLGHALEINDSGDPDRTKSGGARNAISLLNETTTQLASGPHRNHLVTPAAPLCAFSLYSKLMSALAPIELVLLEFTTTPVSAGTVIYQASNQAVLVDLTIESQVAVTFDINHGWSAGGSPGVTLVAPGTSLAPLLLLS
jgi:hypothetical protein